MTIEVIKNPLRKIQYFSHLYKAKKNCLPDFCAEKFNKKEYLLFISHSLGGGTTQYVNNFIKENSNKNILLVNNISYIKDFYYTVEERNQQNLSNENSAQNKYKINSLKEIFKENIKISEIVVNSLVTFGSWNIILDDIIDYKKKCFQNNRNCKISYFVHDFHCICPNYTLFNKEFCNVDCNRKNCNFKYFNNVILGTSKNITDWGNNWSNFFSNTDEIRCFSENSEQILLKKYPFVEKQILVVPHDMSYCHFEPIQIQNDELHIAVVGSIFSDFKGCFIVKEFLKQAKKKNIKVSIIGTLKRSCKIYGKTISYLGSYKQSDLKNILEENKINFVFFPSILPETFSYLVSEIIQTKLPILCFDIGAQADKVKAYENGVCVDVSAKASEVMNSICKTWESRK